MTTIHEHIRAHILERTGVVSRDLAETEWSPVFEGLMRNRLQIGALRYEPLAFASPYDRVGQATKLLREYEATGNDELLVDVANYMLIEFVKGSHPNKHFDAKDNGGTCPIK